jgi:hypothetical protein
MYHRSLPSTIVIHARLSSRDPVIRTEAINSFREAGSEGVTLLAKFVRNHILNSTVRVSRRGRWLIGASTIASPFVFYLIALSSLPLRALLLWFPIAFISFGTNIWRQLPLLRLRYSLVQSMLLNDDTKLLGPLIGCIGLDEANMVSWPRLLPNICGKPKELSVMINQSVIRIVSLLGPEDEIDITNFERGMLLEALRSSSSNLVMALLSLTEQIGDSRELQVIKSLENGKYSAASNPEVREAAANCQSVIEARLAIKAQPDTLLRASQSSNQAAALLRPVGITNKDDESVLLRAGSGEERSE